ncbi:MAG: GyrI-like domain-containing protein [Planctomycetota bacterium]
MRWKSCATLVVGGLVGLLVVLLVTGYWAGAFNRVHLETTRRGPYRIACVPNEGSYGEIAEAIRRAERLLAEQGAAGRVACGIYYNDPEDAPDEELRSKGGYVVGEGVEVEPPLETLDIPGRRVLLATFEGQSNLARARIDPEVDDWFDEHRFEPGAPIIEFYREGGVAREVPLVEPAGAQNSTP